MSHETLPGPVTQDRFICWEKPLRPRACRIVILNRLVYRKGIDLQAVIIPLLCRALPHLRVIIGGDGPKRGVLEAMVVAHNLHSQVSLVGSVQHEAARDLLVAGSARCIACSFAAVSVCQFVMKEGLQAKWASAFAVRLARHACTE
jgi:glycosyltransferase involved in cell wall biosynthesis